MPPSRAADEARARGDEPTFGFWRSLLYSSVLILAFFACAETGVRIWAHNYREEVERFDPEIGTFVLEPGSYPDGAQINSAGFVGPELEPDGPDLWRVYALGDSCTYGGGQARVIYPARLERRLESNGADSVRYEVVNAGIAGLDSELALRRLRAKGPELDPDVVTIYIGWNDLMKFDPTSQQNDSPWSGVARTLDRLWLVKGLRKLIFFYARPRMSPPATGPESRTGRFADFRPSVFEDNLRAIVAEARSLGARPVVATLPTVVREDMTAEEVLEQNVYFPYFPAAYAVGDFLDLVDAYNRSIRRVAAEEQVPVADLAIAFQRIPAVEGHFTDTVHLTYEGHALIAETLHDALERAGLAAPPRTGG